MIKPYEHDNSNYYGAQELKEFLNNKTSRHYVCILSSS